MQSNSTGHPLAAGKLKKSSAAIPQRIYLNTNIVEMFKTLLFALLIIAISFALLAITIIIKKNGRFPNTHVGGSKAMRKRGIKCVQSQDKDARRENPMRVSESSKR